MDKGYIKGSIFLLILLTLTVFFGGFRWQYCIIPLILLTTYCMVNAYRVHLANLIISIVLFVLLLLSVINTQGDMQTAVYEAEKLLLFTAGLCVANLIDRRDFALSMMLVAFVVAVVGVITYCGGVTTYDFVLKTDVLPRLQSFFQYANTAACFLACGYFCFLDNKPDFISVHLYYGIGQTILLALYLTLSKACIPIFLIVLTYFLLCNEKCRQIAIWQNILTMILVLPMAFSVSSEASIIPSFAALICILAGALIPTRILSTGKSILYVWIFVLTVGAAFAAVVLGKSTLLSGSFVQRIHFMQDAAKMLDGISPVGYGPGSWRLLQYQVQSFEYAVTYIHNSFLQILVENGAIFFAIFMIVIIVGIGCAFKSKTHTVVAVLMVIMLHSFVDFNLSYGVMLFVLGVSAGIGCNDLTVTKKIRNRVLRKSMEVLWCIMLLFSVLYMCSEYTVRSSFERAYVEGDYFVALEKAKSLEKLCPGDSNLQISLAGLEQRVDNNKDVIANHISNAVKLSPNDYKLYKIYMKNNKRKENIKAMCIRYHSLCPQRDDTYTFINEFSQDALMNGLITYEMYNEIVDTFAH